MKPVALGLIGCGVIGKAHARTTSQSSLVDLIAVADSIPERSQEVAKEYKVPTTYLDGMELLEDKRLEAVILALPAGFRTKLALQSLKNGLHAIIEKPIAMNADEVESIISARGDLVAVCGCSRPRFSGSAQFAVNFVASDALGEIRVINCRAINSAGEPPKADPPAWRLKKAQNGGGILMNWGCYDLDYLLGLAGWKLKPIMVLGKTWTVPPLYESHVTSGSDAETHVTAIIICEGGTVINYERSEYTSARSESMWQITGAKGSLHLKMVGRDDSITFDEGSTEHGVTPKVIYPQSESQINGMLAQLDDFAMAIREGRQPETNLEKVLMVQKITDAIYESSDKGITVKIK